MELIALATECSVRAFGAARASLDGIAALRKAPGPPLREPLPASLLKHADEQSVVGLAAVAHAIHDCGLRERTFADWGVLGAPRFPGRLCVREQFLRFRQEGALGVSPHIIPHRSTHSLSGTLSLALQMRGTNFGVGGGEGALVEGLLAGLAVITEGRLPGLWLVLTEWDPEPVPGRPRSATGAVCHAVALALAATLPDDPGPRLRLVPAGTGGAALPAVSSLADFLMTGRGPARPRSWTCPLEWGAVLELTPAQPAGIAMEAKP